jgi:hypothetical protein
MPLLVAHYPAGYEQVLEKLPRDRCQEADGMTFWNWPLGNETFRPMISIRQEEKNPANWRFSMSLEREGPLVRIWAPMENLFNILKELASVRKERRSAAQDFSVCEPEEPGRAPGMSASASTVAASGGSDSKKERLFQELLLLDDTVGFALGVDGNCFRDAVYGKVSFVPSFGSVR